MRSIVEYSNAKILRYRSENDQLLKILEFKSERGINTIYPEQEKCGNEIANILINDLTKINILVCGKTQTGKTGCMLAVIKSLLSSEVIIPISNIFIITGLSSIDWINDTKSRMPGNLRNNIFHRGTLKNLIHALKNKYNCLILIDEIQIGGESIHTIAKIFEEIGLFDINYLYSKNIKIVQFTATPDGHLYDILNWGHMSAIVRLNPGIGYISAYDLLQSGRVKQYKSLYDVKAIMEIKTIIYSKYRYGTTENSSRYHTIRIPSSKNGNDRKLINMFKNVFGNGFEYEESFLDSKRMDINNVIKDEPFMHTFIFIKDILRCAKTKYKRYLGVEYERYAPNTYDSTIIQGSVGRLTGYDDNGDSICFTNIESIEKYQTLWESSFMAPVNWYSGTTRKDGKRNAKLTYNSINLYENTGDIKPPQQVIPFIKWLGGKTKNLGKILCKFPAVIDNYYEPFLGGGSVLFGLLNSIEEKKTTLRGNIYVNDINSALIGTYKNIQLHCDELIAELKRIYNDYETAKPGTVINKKATTRQEGMASQESYYYYCRSEYNKIPKNQKTTITASALFIFINRTCFKGLFREGPRGLNMAYGHYVDISLNDEIIDNIRRVSNIIRNVIITDHSYTVALADVKDNDVVYMDPPHLEKKKKCAYDFDEKEYKKLFAICDNLAERCTVIFSGENKNYIKNHFSNNIVEYEINESKTRSAINAKRPGKLVEELLIRNLRQ